jgi:hypothetical protein
LKKTVDSLSSTMEALKDHAGIGLREQLKTLTSVTESLKDKTVDAIGRLQNTIRGKPEEKPPKGTPPGRKGLGQKRNKTPHRELDIRQKGERELTLCPFLVDF